MIRIFRVQARSFEGRLPLRHDFTIAAENEEDAREAVMNRWPELYEIQINPA